jgi:hypothetical protein
MPEATSAPSAVTPNPSTARAVQEQFAKSDIRNTQEFKETFKAFRAKAKPTVSDVGEPRQPRVIEKPPEQKEVPKPEPVRRLPPELGEEEDEAPEAPTIPEDEETEPAETAETEEKADEKPEQPVTPEKGKKVSAWRLVDEWKKKAANLERELAAIKGKAIPEADSKQLTERLTQTEAKLKEYEDEIRHVNYQKSPEFLEKYQKPYEMAFKRAVAELSEVPVTDAAGAQRPASAEDMLALVSLPLGRAREVANQMFGDFADDAMTHRKEIKSLFEQRQAAIEDAKTHSAEREKQRTEQSTKQQSEVQKQVTEAWERYKNEPLTDSKFGSFFTPREGDQHWNQRLAKGFELVDKAFNDPSPRDPKLSPEDREKIVKRHAAVRARAAGWGALRYENETLRNKLNEVQKALSEYKSTEPGSAGGSRSQAKPKTESSDAWGKVKEGLRKYAKPM